MGIKLGRLSKSGSSLLNLYDLRDVDITNPETGDILQYNSDELIWKNASLDSTTYTFLENNLIAQSGIVITPNPGSETLTFSLGDITPTSVNTSLVNLTGTSAKIIGNFTSDTPNLNQRVAFQSNVPNGFTLITAIPNGTSTIAGVMGLNSSDPNNSSGIYMAAEAGRNLIRSTKTGTGLEIPLNIETFDKLAIRVETNGNVLMPQNLAITGGITTDGNINCANLIASDVVAASGQGGFLSTTFLPNARNPIWRFGNAPGFGISFFQGVEGYSGADSIGFHFGNAIAAGSILNVGTSNVVVIKDAGPNPTYGQSQVIIRSGGANPAALSFWREGVSALQLQHRSQDLLEVFSNDSDSPVDFKARSILVGNTAVASPTALDWYEEGTWTPTVESGGGAIDGNYTIRIGNYTRIGNVVRFKVVVGWTGNTITGGGFAVRGLPFTPAPGSQNYNAVASYSKLPNTASGWVGQFYTNPGIPLISSDQRDFTGTPVLWGTPAACAHVMLTGTYEV